MYDLRRGELRPTFRIKPGKTPTTAQNEVVWRVLRLLSELDLTIEEHYISKPYAKAILGAATVGAVQEPVARPELAQLALDTIEEEICERNLQDKADRALSKAINACAGSLLIAALLLFGTAWFWTEAEIAEAGTLGAFLASVAFLLTGIAIGRLLELALDRRKRLTRLADYTRIRHDFRKPGHDITLDIATALIAALFFATGLVQITVAESLSTRDINQWLVGISVGVLIGLARLAFVTALRGAADKAIPANTPPPVAGG